MNSLYNYNVKFIFLRYSLFLLTHMKSDYIYNLGLRNIIYDLVYVKHVKLTIVLICNFALCCVFYIVAHFHIVVHFHTAFGAKAPKTEWGENTQHYSNKILPEKKKL